MSLLLFASILASSSLLFVWYGLFDQIVYTRKRKTVSGLSLTEAEAKLWGKLPWILFATTLTQVDLTVLISNLVGIALGTTLLLQFVFYSEGEVKRRNIKRIGFQFFLLIATCILAFIVPQLLVGYETVVKTLPVFVTIAALLLGSLGQALENFRLKSTQALSLKRYLALLVSYGLWCFYGYVKHFSTGWDEAWTICVSTGLGVFTSSVVLMQFYLYAPVSVREGRILRWVTTP